MRLEAENLTKKYDGRAVLEGVSFALAPGEALHVDGESGSGKTTLLHILAGLRKPDEGRVICTDESEKPCIARIAMVFQEDRLIEHLSAAENIRLCAEGITPRHARELLGELLPGELADRPVRELSGGERRRVCIVRAFAAPSDILLLDEPFAGLDEDNHREAAAYVRAHQGERPLVITSHEDVNLTFCRRIELNRK